MKIKNNRHDYSFIMYKGVQKNGIDSLKSRKENVCLFILLNILNVKVHHGEPIQ